MFIFEDHLAECHIMCLLYVLFSAIIQNTMEKYNWLFVKGTRVKILGQQKKNKNKKRHPYRTYNSSHLPFLCFFSTT